ncbi:MAG: hypothetical protein AAGH99_13250 [Planctomycetota bacterium]
MRSAPETAGTAPQRLVLASDPRTPAARLAELAADGNLRVRQAAAANPALPTNILELLYAAGATRDLAGMRPWQLELGSDELRRLSALGEWGRRLASRHPDTPVEQLVELASDGLPAVRRSAAEHPRCPASCLVSLSADAVSSVRTAAAGHPAMPAEVMALWLAAGALPDLSGFSEAFTSGAEVDFDTLIGMGPWGKVLAARHPAVGRPRLDRLRESADWKMIAAIAENPSADPELLEYAADLDRFDVKLRVAGHPGASTEVLDRLSSEVDTRLRVAVAQNPNAPAAVLRRLACDGTSAVRAYVAVHANFAEADRRLLVSAGARSDLMGFGETDSALSAEAIDRLARRGHWGEWLAARHPNTAAGTFERLLTSADPMLREAALRRAAQLDLLGVLRDAGSREDLQGFTEPRRALSEEEQVRLAGLGPWANRVLARHPQTRSAVLAGLATDNDPQIRREVARHEGIGESVQIGLASDVSHDVRWALVNRGSLSAEVLGVLLGDPLPTIRVAAVQNRRTPTAAIGSLRFDLDEDVRAAVRERMSSASA